MIELLETRRLMSTYYVDAVNGSDANTGKTAKLAWQTLNTVDGHTFRSGDKILLNGTFSDQMLMLGSNAAGVTVNSYTYSVATKKTKTGVAGAATIAVSTTDGVQISASKVTVENLIITSTSAADGAAIYTSGIHLLNSGSTAFTGDVINQVAASGFSYAGLSMQGWNTSATDSAGFSNVTIENSTFFTNAVSGIYVGAGDNTGQNFGPDFPATLYLNSNLTIKNCQTFNNAGFNSALANFPNSDNPNDGNATSGGIFLSSVNGATVQNCISYGNSFASQSGVGIWAFDATRVDFLSDESYSNQTANFDGDGFDFDHGVTNSIMQYDYSHDNAGAGYLLTTNGGTSNNNNITVRYNISDNDGQENSYGGIMLYAPTGVPLVNANIYNNTIITGPVTSGTPASVLIMGDAIATSSVNILNNIFYSGASEPAVTLQSAGASIKFLGNDYWSTDATHFEIDWLGTTYNSLTDFQAATGEENLSGKSVGQNEDPQLPAESIAAPVETNITLLTRIPLSLAKTSALRKQGLNLTTRTFKVAPFLTTLPYNLAGMAWGGIGKRDFFNHPVDASAIGAG